MDAILGADQTIHSLVSDMITHYEENRRTVIDLGKR